MHLLRRILTRGALALVPHNEIKDGRIVASDLPPINPNESLAQNRRELASRESRLPREKHPRRWPTQEAN